MARSSREIVTMRTPEDIEQFPVLPGVGGVAGKDTGTGIKIVIRLIPGVILVNRLPAGSFRSRTRRFAAKVRASRGFTVCGGRPMTAAVFLVSSIGSRELYPALESTASWIVWRYSSAWFISRYASSPSLGSSHAERRTWMPGSPRSRLTD